MTTTATPPSFQGFRLLAILIEAIPVGILILGLILGFDQLIVIGFMITILMYLSASFYLFKAEKFKTIDVLAAIFGGILIMIILTGILFGHMQWPQAFEMLVISQLTLHFGLIFSLVLVLAKNLKAERRKFEFRMSLKLFSRFLILILYFYLSGIGPGIETIS